NIPGHLTLWDVQSLKEKLRLVPHREPISAVALTSDGKLLATAGDGGVIRLWDVLGPDSLVARASLRPPAPTHALAFTPDGRTLASFGTEREIHLWQAELGQSLGQIACPTWSQALAFAPDGRTLAVTDLEGGLILLPVATAEEVQRIAMQPATSNVTED